MGYTLHDFQPNQVLHAAEMNELDVQIRNNLVNTATIQDTNVAVKNYKVGEYLTLDGILYEVTSAIATGGTITPGSNCSNTNVGDEITAVKDEITAVKEALSTWESITEYTDQSLITNIYQGLTLGVFTAIKSGNVVNGVITFYPSGTVTLPNNTTIAKMPTYLAPAKSLNVVAYNNGGRHMLIYLNHNGEIATSWGDTVTTALSIPFTVITSE